jgi:hypothetical protein
VQECDIAFRERDDADADEREPLEQPAVSSWSRLNRSSDSARTTSTSLRSADCIIAWKPERSSVAPETAWSEYSFAICHPCRRANSRQILNWSAIEASRWLSEEYRA